MLLYDTPSYEYLVGSTGGFLLANNIHMFMLFQGIDVHGREIQPWQTYEELLLQSVGNDFASELPFYVKFLVLKVALFCTWVLTRLILYFTWS